MSYELWDTQTRNIVETFESEAEALEATRQLIAVNMPVYPDELALVFEDDQGNTTLVGSGSNLEGLIGSRE